MLQRILSDAAAVYGDKVALVTPGRTLSFAELDALSSAFAGALRRGGI
jgi:non-ribosomal peptide synthetase component E (peptide arylation enzyme)